MRALLLLLAILCVPATARAQEPASFEASAEAPAEPPVPAAEVLIKNRRIQKGQNTLAQALAEVPLPHAQVQAVVSALEAAEFDFRRIRVGDQFRMVIRHGELDFFDFRQNRQNAWLVRRDGDRYVGLKREVEVEQRVATVDLTVNTSLWDAVIGAGEKPGIAVALADVFAWDVDFYQDVRQGDRVRAVIEKRLVKGRLVDYGNVLAAEYLGETVGHKRVFRYETESGQVSYFQQDGSSARKAFLKSPLKYANVTSRFGSRFHPVLKYMKAHNGVDYGAAVGTPVWAPADGTVTRVSYDGANGNLLCLRHLNGFETCYAHLHRVHVRKGQRVQQKQVVALTGNTGRSTGPHLHYALKRNGQFVNPLTQNFPRAEPVPKAELSRFTESIAPLVAQLDAVSVAAIVPAPGTETTAVP